MSRFLQFWCKLNTRRIVKTCSFRFLHNYYGDALDFTFPQFPNHFLPFSMVFPRVSLVFLRFPRVFLLFSLSASSVFYFRCCEYQSRSVSLVKETFGKISTSHKILWARLQVSEIALMGYRTFNSNKIYFVLIA